jgi:hypothetical protein
MHIPALAQAASDADHANDAGVDTTIRGNRKHRPGHRGRVQAVTELKADILFLLDAREIIDETEDTVSNHGFWIGRVRPLGRWIGRGHVSVAPNGHVSSAVSFHFLSSIDFLVDSTERKNTSVLFGELG